MTDHWNLGDIGADTGKFYARVINALMHNKMKNIEEKLYMDLLDLCEKYSDELGVPDFAQFRYELYCKNVHGLCT